LSREKIEFKNGQVSFNFHTNNSEVIDLIIKIPEKRGKAMKKTLKIGIIAMANKIKE
jgi:hypothetical protein